MCIMEVRAGQRSSTIAQACAHNVTTVERDADMFVGLLVGRGELERAKGVTRAQAHLVAAYADLLELFGEFANEEEDELGRHYSADDAPGADGTHEHADLGRISHTHDEHNGVTLGYVRRTVNAGRRFMTR